MMKTKVIVTVAAIIVLAACSREADVASRNLSVAADQFEINRRIVFLNGITDTNMLVIEGFCSIADQGNQLEVTCKTGAEAFKKHFLGLSDNVTYFAEQMDAADVARFHHRIVFRPQAIIPDVDFEGSLEELTE